MAVPSSAVELVQNTLFESPIEATGTYRPLGRWCYYSVSTKIDRAVVETHLALVG